MTIDTINFELRYVGARFDRHRLPLDVLPDLSAFRDLLVSYVKAGWRATNEKRVRLPKGFEKSTYLNEKGNRRVRLAWTRVEP